VTRNVVEPEALAQIVKQLCGFHLSPLFRFPSGLSFLSDRAAFRNPCPTACLPRNARTSFLRDGLEHSSALLFPDSAGPALEPSQAQLWTTRPGASMPVRPRQTGPSVA